MIDVNELRKGVTFEFDGQIWKVLDYLQAEEKIFLNKEGIFINKT